MAIQVLEFREVVGTRNQRNTFVLHKQTIFRFPDVAFLTSFKLDTMSTFHMSLQISNLAKIIAITHRTAAFLKQFYHGNDLKETKKKKDAYKDVYFSAIEQVCGSKTTYSTSQKQVLRNDD